MRISHNSNLISNRRARRVCIALIALLILPSVSLMAAGSREPERTSRTELLLGTTVTVTTYGKVPNGVVDQVFERVAEIERRMSTSEEDYSDTELLRVNAAAGVDAVVVSPDTFSVVEQGLAFSRMSDGAFDVTVGPLVKLWGIGTDHAAIPDPEDLARALDLVDYHDVQMNPDDTSIKLAREGMALDVGGIAKGYAADEAARILTEAGVSTALLDFGGNILTVGSKPDGSPFRIGIQVPDATRGEYLGIATVSDKAVVTSGTYERYFEVDGVRYHHILDTTTGYPVNNGLDSVTIITPESIRADALSTVVFALGLDEGRTFVESLDAVEAIFVTHDDDVYMTSGAGSFFELTNESYTLRD